MVLENVQYYGRKVDMGIFSSEVLTSTPQTTVDDEEVWCSERSFCHLN